ncbi:MAG: DUF1850 domain-containing protein [Rhodobacteraceae bacterium]|nr:DUF1850 domain-containing protein [Paracoccaceae bacterium]
MAAALLLVLCSAPAGAGQCPSFLDVTDDRARVVETLPLGRDGRFCLWWSHSVTGGDVADCFRIEDGMMTLERSYLHDFAAGLGEVAGRGRLRPAEGGGYWIEDIAETLPPEGLALRVGPTRVGHRLRSTEGEIALSKDHAGQRLRLRPGSACASPRSIHAPATPRGMPY